MAQNLTEQQVAEQLHVVDKDGTEFTEEELLLANQSPNKIVTSRPATLGYLSMVFIIVNRMIGTGIFKTPTTVAHGTHSVGYSMLFWASGAVVAICGTYVFAEYGCTIPRLPLDEDSKQSVPRNGGEKNYLEYLVKTPKRLAVCLYGIPFIVVGTAAGNAMICAECILRIAGDDDPAKAAVRGLALGLATLACLLHATWRTGGIRLFIAFGMLKLCMLIAIFVLGVIYTAGGLRGSNGVANENLSIHNSTADAIDSAFGYAEAFLAVLFAYGGFNQVTYVLGEVDNPRKKFKPTTLCTVLAVGVLYILVNLAYMMVVPAADQFEVGPDTVAALFFSRIFGDRNANTVQNTFMAFSSFGNILVQTFTASRVKQEIAKEGFLRPKGSRQAATPAGALFLHWTFTVILIGATSPGNTDDSYRIFVSLYSFVVDTLFGFAIGLGILVLRLTPSFHWSSKSKSNKYLSVSAALVFTVSNCFPLVAVWVQPSGNSGIVPPVHWWVTGTIGFGLLGFALLYWVGLEYVAPVIRGRELEVEREYQFKQDHGYWVIWHEVTSVNWRKKYQGHVEHTSD